MIDIFFTNPMRLIRSCTSAVEDDSHHSKQHVNRRKTMKKTIWLAAGVAGMLLGNPTVNAQAETRDIIQPRSDHSFVIDARPSFIYLPDQGFAVSVDSPYDIISGDDHYYMNQKGSWYRSSSYRGPWKLRKEKNLPSKIKKHRLEDIRMYRDAEYNKIINQRNSQQQRMDNNRPR
uniref:Uncharacterized protein n=1 Tax=Chlorobium chlorochromatii (strain CaD3) TaxID=340177 RepID=Q3ARS3_CHLCH